MKKNIFQLMMALVVTASFIGCSDDKIDYPLAAKADRSSWAVTAVSSEQGDGSENTGLASAVLDGDLNTIWHTQYDPDHPGYPHWFVVDMKKTNKMISVDLTARQNNKNGFTKFKLEGSANGESWTTLGEFTFVPATITPQSFPVSSAVGYQYLKFTALEGLAVHTFLAEMEVFVNE